MTEKDLQELIYLSHSINAMKKQIIENLDALATRVEILLPEDTTTRRKYRKGMAKDWKVSDAYRKEPR